MASALTFFELSKRFDKQSVLANVSFDVEEGEFFALVGVNGAGKTTLYKCLLDFYALNEGSIRIFGIDHHKTSARNALVFLPEKFKPPYYLTGNDFLSYMSELHGHDLDVTKVEELLEVLDMDLVALSRPVRQYSKGMGQKLGLCSCLLSNKKLIILDEPMSGLDPRSRANLKQYLLKLKGKGITLFFSTHLLEDVEILCDRLAILHAGQLRFLGSPARCCQQYTAQNLEQAYMRCIERVETVEPG